MDGQQDQLFALADMRRREWPKRAAVQHRMDSRHRVAVQGGWRGVLRETTRQLCRMPRDVRPMALPHSQWGPRYSRRQKGRRHRRMANRFASEGISTMSKDEFIAKWRNDLAGRILEGVTAEYRGAQLGVWARGVLSRVDMLLEQMHNDLVSD